MKAFVARPHWSYSSVSQYLRCPLQYYFERVVKLPRTTMTDAQVLGSALHSALADYHRKLQSREPVSTQQVHEAYLSAWDAQAGRSQIVCSGSQPLEISRDVGFGLVELYLKEPPPETIVAVEAPILTPVVNSHGEYLETPILVIPDLITQQKDGSLLVGEIKTSGRAFSESEVATSLQPTFYANALHEMTGEEPGVEYTVLVKTRTPKVQRIQAIRTSGDYYRLGDIIGAVESAVRAGIFYPIESPMNCAGCPFYRPCREWTGPRTDEARIISNLEEFAQC